MSQEFDVLCLGGGVAGEALAEGLRDSGLTLAVVERELVGGECPYWGCIPSKTLLRSGETLSEAGRARHLAAVRVDWIVDFPKVSTRVRRMARDLDDSRPAAAMQGTGATLVRGEGTLIDDRTIAVGSARLTARRALVIANGGTAAIPSIPGLDAIDFWTNRQAAIPRELPASLAVLGGGPLGVELAQAFARLGSRVTIIEAGPMFLGLEEPEAGAALRPHLEADGITLMIGDPCIRMDRSSAASSRRSEVVLHLKSGTMVAADRLLIATGRRPNAEVWGAASLPRTERGWLKVDPATLEVRPGVFGAGDVTGFGGFTHLAYYHGQIIARRLRGIDARADHTAVPRVTYTDPEVASVGLSEAVARAQGIDVVVAAADPAESARGYIHDFHGGALKLVADRERGVLIGATLVTPRAGEIVGELVLAIKLGTPLHTLADVIHPFPAFNRVLGASLDELAAKTSVHRGARSGYEASRKSEVVMSNTPPGSERPTTFRGPTTVDTKLEVVVIPVADVDRSKRFYEGLGWKLDAEFAADNGFRIVQLTPPGSPCSIQFGTMITTGAPGSAQNLYLVVTDIDAARQQLAARGANVSEVFHPGTPGAQYQRNGGRISGPAPDRASYGSFATFSDPDGNSWLIQEVTTRRPGRGLSLDVATLTDLLRETENAHGAYEATAPKHHWSDWYAGYMVARERGKTADEASAEAARRLAARADVAPA